MGKKNKKEAMVESRADAEIAMHRLYQIEMQLYTWASDEANAVAKARAQCQIERDASGVYALEAEYKRLLKDLKSWAKGNFKNWPGKSLETPHGEFGFRRNTPSVALIKKVAGKFEDALVLLKEKLKRFVKTETVERIDKELILKVAAETEPETIALLNECGLVIEQKDEFWVETLIAEKLKAEIKKAKEA